MLWLFILLKVTDHAINSKEMPPGTEQIVVLLTRLSEKMDAHRCEPLSLVVCGGAALRVLGVMNRPTKDIDVIAISPRCVRFFSGAMLVLCLQ